MGFTPRMNAPSQSDKWWIHSTRGGYNDCIMINGGPSCLPNCVGYAWGRFGEILGEKPRLCRGNAGEWFGYGDGYQRGQTPFPGAVMCFSKPGAAGHVAIVEQVQGATIITSESGYGSFRFKTAQRTPNSNGSYSRNGYIFQGFIYNPAVTPESLAESPDGALFFRLKTRKEVFMEAVEGHVNQDNSWVCSQTGISKNQAWSAAFILACAKQSSSLLNVIIPNTYSCGAIGRIGVLRDMGKWFRGPLLGGSISPEVGDILLFRKGHYSQAVNEYFSDHCAIVTGVSGNTVNVVEGDFNGVSASTSYPLTSQVISGLFRPDWSRVDEIMSIVPPSYKKIQGLYTDSVSMQDAAVREVGYMNTQYQPSIQSGRIHLSMLNYTGLLGDMYSVFGGVLSASDDSNTSDESDFIPTLVPTGLSPDGGVIQDSGEPVKVCFDFLKSKGLNSAAACGILGNIQAESGFRTSAIGDNGTSFGICQWHNNRGTAMKSVAGSDWATNLSGQLNYLWFELNNSYKNSVLVPLTGVPNTADGAAKAADIFVRKFEVPANVDKASQTRQANARSYFAKVVNQL